MLRQPNMRYYNFTEQNKVSSFTYSIKRNKITPALQKDFTAIFPHRSLSSCFSLICVDKIADKLTTNLITSCCIIVKSEDTYYKYNKLRRTFGFLEYHDINLAATLYHILVRKENSIIEFIAKSNMLCDLNTDIIGVIKSYHYVV